ncbi:hypothetical protein WA026_009322 [Henosepilachna vigintioctopunctata]|uniref:ferroxidase n=1 Tax=Henosepilachna vigintioctopunctata TaxID=420089 RepID=A0AAW1URE2_9CUCU
MLKNALNIAKITRSFTPFCNKYYIVGKRSLFNCMDTHLQNINSNFISNTQCRKLSNQHSLIYEKACEETLESLTEFFEDIMEKYSALACGDVTYNDGVLTVNLGKDYGTYVINRQSPNKQIWLSSPISGPKRFDYVEIDKYWIYKHDGQTLHNLLKNELSSILQKEIDISKCAYYKI